MGGLQNEMIVNVESLIRMDSIYLYEGRPYNGIGFANSTKKGEIKPSWGYYFEEGKMTETRILYDEIEKRGGYYVSEKVDVFEDYLLHTEFYPNGKKMKQAKYTEYNPFLASETKGYPSSEFLIWTPNDKKIVVGNFDEDGKLIKKIKEEEVDKLLNI